MVEQRPFKALVVGSSPTQPTHQANRSRPRPRESLFVANRAGIGSMCSVRIAPA
jgi:hypothetical protein